MALLGAWTLYNRSLSRGQDYVYAGAGAGALISLPIMAFANGGVLTFSVSFLTGVLCGLAFAQSLSGGASGLKSSELQDLSDEVNSPHGKGRLAWSTTFHKKWLRAALAIFGLVLTAQAAWIFLLNIILKIIFRGRLNGTSVRLASGGTKLGWRPRLLQCAVTFGPRADWLGWPNRGPILASRWTMLTLLYPRCALSRVLCTIRRIGVMFGLCLRRLRADTSRPGTTPPPCSGCHTYTAPNELLLLPLRLHVALGLEVTEFELRDMIKRDIRIVLSLSA